MKKEWKKQAGLTLASLLLCVPLTLSGCSSNRVTGNSENPDSSATQQEESGFESMVLYSKEQNGDLSYLRKVEGDNPYDNKYDFDEHGDFWQYAVKITSTAELEAAMGEKWDKYDSYGNNFSKGQLDIAQYDDAFFAEKSLLVLCIYSGMNPVHLEALEKETDGSIIAEIYEEREDDAKADRIVLLFAEMEKGYFDADTEIEVRINTQSINYLRSHVTFKESYQAVLYKSDLPQIKDLQVNEEGRRNANVIIDDYENYQEAFEAVINTDSHIKIPEISEKFFEEKVILLHFGEDSSSKLYEKRIVKNISVQNKVMKIDANINTVPGVFTDMENCWNLFMFEIDRNDVKNVESFEVDQKKVIVASNEEQ